MTGQIGILDYIVIGAMMLISLAIGLYVRYSCGRRMTLKDYLLAGGDMEILPVVVSLTATILSAITLLGETGESYLYGSTLFIIAFSIPCGALIVTYGCIPIYFNAGLSTVFEYLDLRFGKTIRFLVSLLFTLQQILYMPVVLYAPSLALVAVTGLNVWTSVLAVGGICTIYCFLGGLKAVLWTDLFQACLMFVTVLSVAAKGISDNGFMNIIETAKEGGRMQLETSVHSSVRYSVWNLVIAGIVYGMFTFASNQTQIQRIMSVGTLAKAKKSIILSLPLHSIFKLLCVFDGLVIYSYFYNCDPIRDKNNNIRSGDQLIIYFIQKMFNHLPGVTGLCIAGIFSASLSTLSSIMSSLSAVTLEDMIKPYCLRKELKEATSLLLAKSLALAYGIIAVLLSFVVSRNRTILEVSTVIISLTGAPTFGVYALGMFTSTANEPGTTIGLICGFTLHAIMGFGAITSKVRYPPLPLTTEGCLNNSHSSLYSLNSTDITSFQNVTQSVQSHLPPKQDVSSLFKVSYVWLAPISFSTVIVIGYLASVLISIWKKYPPTDPKYFSPFVRKWFVRSRHSYIAKQDKTMDHIFEVIRTDEDKQYESNPNEVKT